MKSEAWRLTVGNSMLYDVMGGLILPTLMQ